MYIMDIYSYFSVSSTFSLAILTVAWASHFDAYSAMSLSVISLCDIWTAWMTTFESFKSLKLRLFFSQPN